MITGITRSGFSFDVNENIVEDWRVVEALAATSAESDIERTRGVVSLVNLLLGERKTALITSVTREDGIAHIQDVMDNVSDILDAIAKARAQGKN